MMAPMARSGSAHGIKSGVLMHPIFIHPSHGLIGSEPFQINEASFTNPFPASVEDTLNRVNDLTLSSPSSPALSDFPESPTDYFSTRHHSDASSYSTRASSASSSNCSTPTREQPYPKAPVLSRNNSTFHLTSSKDDVAIVSPLPSPFPAAFSFSTFAAPGSNPPSRPSSPPRVHPYARRAASNAGGSSMQRSVSSPVETQRQLDTRRRAMSQASEALSQQAGKMSRSKSVAGLSTPTGLGFVATPMRTSSPRPSSPLVTPFGDGWGAALPPREEVAPPMIPFPYNVAMPPKSPTRLGRSHSVSGTEASTIAPPIRAPGLQRHRGSLPNVPIVTAAAPSSPSSRRRSLLAPLTPIIPSSPLMAVDEMADLPACTNSFAAAVESHHSSPNQKPALVRGVTY